MKKIYDYIKESLLDDEDIQLDRADLPLIQQWIKDNKYKFLYNTTLTNGMIDCEDFFTIDKSGNEYKDIELPFPSIIKFNHIENLDIQNYNEMDLSKLPEINRIHSILVNPFGQNKIKVDLSKINVKEIFEVYVDYQRCSEVIFPKHNLTNVFLYNRGQSRDINIFDPKDFQDLKCKNLIIDIRSMCYNNNIHRDETDKIVNGEKIVPGEKLYDIIDGLFKNKNIKNIILSPDTTRYGFDTGRKVKKLKDGYITARKITRMFK